MPDRARRLGTQAGSAKRLTRDDNRGTAAARGYDRKWRAYRLGWLADSPFCVVCEAAGRIVLADTVDHIRPHRGDQTLFWDPSNHQSLCKRCHDQKTARGE